MSQEVKENGGLFRPGTCRAERLKHSTSTLLSGLSADGSHPSRSRGGAGRPGGRVSDDGPGGNTTTRLNQEQREARPEPGQQPVGHQQEAMVASDPGDEGRAPPGPNQGQNQPVPNLEEAGSARQHQPRQNHRQATPEQNQAQNLDAIPAGNGNRDLVNLDDTHTEALRKRMVKTTKATMKVATLNIRGGHSEANREKWSHLNRILKEKRIAILAIQEGHLTDTD
ncbi:hypothetical protein CPC08DRAFT_756147, partial [Agrocybe pediades]